MTMHAATVYTGTNLIALQHIRHTEAFRSVVNWRDVHAQMFTFDLKVGGSEVQKDW